MLSRRIMLSTPKFLKRNIGMVAPALQKVNDPIAQIFLDKIKEFKSKKDSGKLDTPPELAKELNAELEKLSKAYGGGQGVDLTAFPKFSFPEPKVDVGCSEPQPTNQQQHQHVEQ